MRKPASTDPPTFTSLEVSQIFRDAITQQDLYQLDGISLLRPTYYFDSKAPGKVITPKERDARITKRGPNRGSPRRRYTYSDLLWISIFIYVKETMLLKSVKNATRRAGEVLAELRKLTNGNCPPASRLLFHGKKDVYFLRDNDIAECLTRPGQPAMAQLLTDKIFADLRGRVTVLAAHGKIRRLDLDREVRHVKVS